jgi:hypothetical protein
MLHNEHAEIMVLCVWVRIVLGFHSDVRVDGASYAIAKGADLNTREKQSEERNGIVR